MSEDIKVQEMYQLLGAVVALDMVKEQIETVQTIYDERSVRHQDEKVRKLAKYRYNKCQKALTANTGVINDLYSDLKATGQGEEVLQGLISHFATLYFRIINLDAKHQDRVIGLVNQLEKL